MTLEELKKKKVSAISLGCDKNRVDLEKMLYNLKYFGFDVIDDVENAEIVIVNTCAFIKPAIQEAVDNIIYATDLKKNICEKVIVTGCLPARFNNDKSEINGVDAVIDIKQNSTIVEIVLGLYGIDGKYDFREGRLLTNLPHFAYLKIADGCDNGCAYCTIPRIRGRYRSVPMEDLIKEAKNLADMGVKEIILIAQDITRYGQDLYGEYRLVKLIREISKIKNIKWIRLHYCYPELVSDELLNEIYNNPKVCKYLDIPLQHIDDKILKEMNRKTTESDIRALFEKLNTNYPNIAVRSTFIVGFPGETKKQFNKLLNFLKEARISHAGFFPFSKEERTKAYFMKKQVWNITKKRRLKKAQKVQEQIMNAININKIGGTYDAIIDIYDDEEKVYVARLSEDSPDVDFIVLIEATSELKIGEIYKVKVLNFIDNIFLGEVNNESTK
ncbi:MAG: 30S ribosomal protein S12 methylthiotransferase RimO [Clostridia bacterium]|nr:30S ribosomal protein S12 methylthiotransferase RimO [Clostridia bacterium]